MDKKLDGIAVHMLSDKSAAYPVHDILYFPPASERKVDYEELKNKVRDLIYENGNGSWNNKGIDFAEEVDVVACTNDILVLIKSLNTTEDGYVDGTKDRNQRID